MFTFNPVVSTSVCAAVLVGTLAASTPALAERQCAPREAVVERLNGTYGEVLQSIGLGVEGVMVETFVSEETGTWTITVTTPNGNTCLVASGQSWMKAPVQTEIKLGEDA